MHFALRAIAAATVAVLIGLPVTRVVCAKECARAHEHASETAADKSEHCSHLGVSGTSLITADDDACDIIGLRNLVTRERTSGPSAPTHHSTLFSMFTEARHVPERRAVSPVLYRGSMAGLSPGTILPLRV